MRQEITNLPLSFRILGVLGSLLDSRLGLWLAVVIQSEVRNDS